MVHTRQDEKANQTISSSLRVMIPTMIHMYSERVRGSSLTRTHDIQSSCLGLEQIAFGITDNIIAEESSLDI